MPRAHRPARLLAATLAAAALAGAGCGGDDAPTAELDASDTSACQDLEAVVGLPADVDPSAGYDGLVDAVPDDAPPEVTAALERLRLEVGAAVGAPVAADEEVSRAAETLARYLDCPDLIGGG